MNTKTKKDTKSKKQAANKLKNKQLAAKENRPGGGGSIFGGKQPLSEWVSQSYTRSELEDYVIHDSLRNATPEDEYPCEVLQLLDGPEAWGNMILKFLRYGIVKTQVEGYNEVEDLFFRYFKRDCYGSYKSWLASYNHKMKMKRQA